MSAFYELKSKRTIRLKVFLMLNTILTVILTTITNILYFFIFFEVAILPIFLIMVGWGYQPEKIEVSTLIFFSISFLCGCLRSLDMKRSKSDYTKNL